VQVKVKTLWVREPYLSQILAGRKTVEVRVGYDNIQRLEPGDRLKLNDEYLVPIRRIGRYADFEEMLAHEDAATIAPGLPAGELLDAIRDIYPPDKEALGAVALELGSPFLANEAERARPYEAVLFDMGYTLIYFEPPQEAIVQEALRQIGLERSVAEIDAAVQTVWGNYFADAATAEFPATEEYDAQVEADLRRRLLTHLAGPVDEATFRAYGEALQSRFREPGVMRPYPEVIPVLETLRAQGYRLGIVSNWSWNLRERVEQVELAPYFEIVWASAYAGCNKPHPCIFQQVLDHLQVPASRAFYVGDSYRHDVGGARNAAVDVALLDRSGTADDPHCPVIHNLWEVFRLLMPRGEIARGE
jgi:HAD superfamily hydrolase (TIGR01662 family)